MNDNWQSVMRGCLITVCLSHPHYIIVPYEFLGSVTLREAGSHCWFFPVSNGAGFLTVGTGFLMVVPLK